KMVVHEGFYDVINCHQHGIKNAVGIITVTNYFSDWMIKFLIENQIKVVLGLDNDETGKKNSFRLKQQLDNNHIRNEIKQIVLSDCKDADDILKKYGSDCYIRTYL
ncbi:MAG: toprim domain-containing protein, partial [Candidatus Phytoplasma stylosanthis]|nr:toprim domain-containing protein [Candidatus Phytoplasma stylosanthis]